MKQQDLILAKFIKANINQSIDANGNPFSKIALQAKKEPKISSSSSTLTQLVKKVQLLERKNDELSKYLDKLEEIVGSSRISSNKKVSNITPMIASKSNKILTEIEDQLNVLQAAYTDLKECQAIIHRIQANWNKGKSTSNLLKEAKAVEKKFKDSYERAKNLITKLAKTQRPAALTKDNELLTSIVHWIESTFKDFIKKNTKANAKSKKKDKLSEPEFLPKESTYLLSILPNTSIPTIRFARYIPMYSLPTINGDTVDLYALFEVDLYSPKQKKDKLVPSSVSELMFTLTDDIIRPDKAPKAYVIKSIRDIKGALEYLSQVKGLAIFGVDISGNAETRREKVKEKLTVLNDDDVKVTTDGPFVTVVLPKQKIRKLTPNGDIEPTLEKNLYIDVQRIAGLPIGGNAARYSSGRLKKEKTEKQSNGSIKITYRVLQVKPDQDLIDPIKQKIEDGVPTLDKNEMAMDNWISLLRSQANKELKLKLDEDAGLELDEPYIAD